MKNNIKKIAFSIAIVLITLFVMTINVNALTTKTDYIDVNESTKLENDKLYLSNLTFKDNSNTSSLSFGITGNISNSSKESIEYLANIKYYDLNHNLIAEYNNTNYAQFGENTFNLMSNINILNNHKIDEIKYYVLTIDKKENDIINSDYSPSKDDKYRNYEYVIDKYNINIIVNEDNTLDITENISAYFNIPKHGIFRSLPLRNTITRLDGTTSKNKVVISDISVDDEFSTSRENGNLKIKIGSADRTLTGEKSYVIKYKYNLGKDPVKDYDELYYNLIGSEWDTVIGNITFNIVMPKAFDTSKVGFSSGEKGSISNDKIKYSINNNTISGKYNGILNKNNALTIRCELEEGYFVGANIPVNYLHYVIFILPCLFAVLSIYLWNKYGKDEPVIETVEFYPPQGFNSLDIGFLYKGNAEQKDVTSLLIYLANKGYIKIYETEEKGLFSKSKDFRIVKLKDYDGNNKNEELFLKGLFKNASDESIDLSKVYKIIKDGKERGEKISFSDATSQAKDESSKTNAETLSSVTSSDLVNNFYITMNKIIANVNSRSNKDKIFERSASNKIIFVLLMILASFCIITIPPMLDYGDSEEIIIALVFPGFGLSMLFYALSGKKIDVGTIFLIIWGLLFGGIPFVGFVLPVLMQETFYLIGYFIGLICIFVMVVCVRYLPKRTIYGNEILGKIQGFKTFLETAEKDKLEAMVMDDPTYFYNILPYTYVLGVSDKWIKKFETIAIEAPSWYDSPNAFDLHTFQTFMNTTMTSAQSAMSSSPSSDSGGSSGGGFSGGGSGGGGGGSW